mgnify:CR=1 FL=1
MRSLPRAIWQYAVLLVLLFAIASLAAWTTISDVYKVSDHIVGSEEYSESLNVITFKIWALTMGFMFIAGAFGLWAIQFAAESESRRRIGQIVEGMDYLNDGLLLLDKKGRITAANPSMTFIVPDNKLKNLLLKDAFPYLGDEDIKLLLDVREPNEIMKDTVGQAGRRTIRFRSQTAAGISLIFVSDVTTMRLHELQKQHTARFELIGRLARGVTKDFNNILAGISGHASLLSRLTPGSAELKNSISSIVKESERGALLAGHLLEFSRLSVAGHPTDNLGTHVAKASELARVGLSSGWQVETEIRSDFPVVPLSGLQAEQVVLNLALVMADVADRAGTIRIVAGRPTSDDLLMNVSNEFAAVILISVGSAGPLAPAQQKAGPGNNVLTDEAGVIQSVVRSLVEESGGSIEFLSTADGSNICRIILPYGAVETRSGVGEELAAEIRSYISNWQVLLARPVRGHDYLDETLRQAGVAVERVDNVVSALSRVESGKPLHAIVFDKDLLGNEAVGLLRAMIKLCPSTGLVVLCDDPDREMQDLVNNVVFVSRRTDPARIVKVLVEAKTLTVRRRRR